MKLKLLTATIMMIVAGSVLAKTEKGSQNGKEGVYIGTDIGVSKGKTTGAIKIGYDFGGIRAEISQGKYAKKSQNETVSTSLFKDYAHGFVDIADRDHTAKLDESDRTKGKLNDGITENEAIHDSLREANKEAASKSKDSARLEKERDEADRRLKEAESDHANKTNAANDADSKWKESGIKVDDAINKWQKADEDSRRENDIVDKAYEDIRDAQNNKNNAEKMKDIADNDKKQADDILTNKEKELAGITREKEIADATHENKSKEYKESYHKYSEQRKIVLAAQDEESAAQKNYYEVIAGDDEQAKAEATKRWDDAKAKLAKESQRESDLKKTLDKVFKEQIATSEEAQRAEKKFNEAASERDKAKDIVEQKQKLLEDASEVLGNANKELNKANDNAKEAEKRAREAKDRLDEAKANKDTSEEELERLTKEKESADRDAKEAEERAREAKEKFGDLQSKADKAKKDVEDAKARLKEVQDKANASDEELKDLEEAVDKANKALKDAKDKLEEAKRAEELAPLNADVKYKLDSDVTIANIYYDFHNDTNFTPYIMGGLGIAHNSLTAQLGGNSGYSGKEVRTSKTSFAWQIGAGVGYAITENFTTDFGIKYTDRGQLALNKQMDITHGDDYIGKLDINHKVKLTSTDFTIGIRYLF